MVFKNTGWCIDENRKKTIDDKTVTTVMVLAESERILEIAKMLSGENPTHLAVENARELLTGE